MTQKSAMPIDLDDDEIKEIIGGIEDEQDTLETLKANYMNEAKVIRESISELKKDAKSRGIPLQALNATIRDRTLQRKRQKVVAGLEGKNADAFNQVRNALDDLDGTPLGNAVAKQSKPKTGNGSAKKGGAGAKPTASSSSPPPPAAASDARQPEGAPELG